MARLPVAGRVKTRLIGPFSAHMAAEIHLAMMQCVLARAARELALAFDCHFTLALDGPVSASDAWIPPQWHVADQGKGDLGARIDHVWSALDSGPAMFLGVDSPDLPTGHLWAAARTAQSSAAVGAVADGGYWTLAAPTLYPPLITAIDWGTANVYHQTVDRARQAQIPLVTLPAWHDVDDARDLEALQRRLHGTQDPALRSLAERIQAASR